MITVLAWAVFLLLVGWTLGVAWERQRANAEWAHAWEDYYDAQVFEQANAGKQTYDVKEPEGFNWFGPTPEQKAELKLCLVHNHDWPDDLLEAVAGDHIVRSSE